VLKSSHLGSDVVENFFSLVRGKSHYVSLWEYASIYNRALADRAAHKKSSELSAMQVIENEKNLQKK